MRTFLNSFLLLVFLLPATVIGQTIVTGTVTDEANALPLPGVNILIKGTTTGASTDFDGNYTITANQGDILVFSYLGYATKEITFTGDTPLNVSLAEDAGQLDEVVLIGYGTTTKRDATGSIESVTAEDFTQGNIVTPENLLQGRVAGVSVTTSGAPGSGSEIRIRGGSSINASNNPLIVIDGLPITNDNVGGSRGILASINPNDIESFTVLKDASATAIYGSRAANGVIIIVTKKGRSTFSADYDMQFTFGENANEIDVFSADAFRDIVNSQPINGTTLDTSLLGTANTNWQDEIFRESVSAIHNVTVRGSLFDVLPARFSFGVTKQEGTLLTSQFDRRNLSLALNPTFFDNHLKVNVNANLAFEDNRFADSGQIGSALRYDPTQPVSDPSSPFGGFYQHRDGDIIALGTTNPVAALLQTNNQGDVERFFGNVNLDYKFHFLPELKFVLNLGFDQTSGWTENNAQFATNDDVTANKSLSYQIRKNQSLDGVFNYKKTFGNVDTDLTAGYSYQRFTNEGYFTGNQLDPLSISDTFADPDIVLIGFLGRANLTFFDKYLFTATYRRDGTSRFSEENQWGDFWSGALAWQISDEDFLKDSETISNLKLRVGYGLTGQQEIGERDLFLSRFRAGNENSQFQFGNQIVRSLIPSEINPDLKWEETTTIELGLDYGLFNNRISGSLNVFQKDSEDLLFNAPVPDGSNFSNSVVQNIGTLRIRGLEFSTNVDVVRKEDISWNFNFNATLLDREITELAFGQDVTTGGIAGGTGNFIQLFREGQAPNSFYVFKQLYDPQGRPIEGAFADLNGDNIINDEDRYIKEAPDANVILGFQSNFEYKNFDFAFNLRANLGNYVYNNVNSARSQYELLQDNAVLGNIPTAVLDTNFQRTADVIISDIYVENASFLRMDNITLGYTFNDLSNVIKSVRLWAGMQNVFVITEYSGLDPEVFRGIDNTIYPRPRNILLGANIKF
ncbi:TonB-dependent receptor [Psychroserpens sp.]|uniref:SusC/RagA family TonB-linked outer membrane protein n=1 Tax=Psychroserpens sp. TaxID=2020870 RepID=UPI001B1CDE25|nr:TonB-dependent receptor [Psychroserpens sp.]MBO6605734.1 TonB-dependent receptor [Psychroserpens sp.]MBO6630724.1 TonB-dependent receptor [Psychroserpens sp.]MBO6652895.1 TonB-dependent receptor [Psychroserpens sp.]MBO6681333.1 TonB-dependent receptor [Psychroserpens sp.]MBO6749108.1 TonB-dependent receptor [Psychroserpens sp.]